MSHEEILTNSLQFVLIGGNSIASNLISILGPDFHKLTREGAFLKANKMFPTPTRSIEIYEQFCCWEACMKARDYVEKHLGNEYLIEHQTEDLRT